MRVPRHSLAAALIWLAGSAPSLAAQEAATAIAPPALRAEAANACRVFSPTFSPDAPSERTMSTRYPGGGRLSQAIAAPCPTASVFFDI